MRELPARLNGWHGTPPATRSTDSIPHDERVVMNSEGIRKVAAPREPRDVRLVRTDRPLVGVGSDEHVEPGPLEAERETPRAAEHVNRRGPPPSGQESAHRLEVGGLRTVAVSRRPRRQPAMVGDARSAMRVRPPGVRRSPTCVRHGRTRYWACRIAFLRNRALWTSYRTKRERLLPVRRRPPGGGERDG